MGSDNSQSHPAALISDHELSLDPSSSDQNCSSQSSQSTSTSGFQSPSYYFDDLESSNPFTGTSSEDEDEDEEDEKDEEEDMIL
jgi:hypothetical protein